MRLGTGLAVLGVGVVALGWWGRAEYATFMQDHLTHEAEQVATGSVHGVQTSVEGRDIRVQGIADGAAERDRLIAGLNDVRGRRVVIDELEVLPTADPYTLQAGWQDGALSARGHAPNAAAQLMLAEHGANGLTLAAGAPDGQWSQIAANGLDTLQGLESGEMTLTGRMLHLSGTARTPAEGEALLAAMGDMPEGYEQQVELSYLDDGSPAAYGVHYSVARGAWVDGKLPRGVGAEDIASALGLPAGQVSNDASEALMGDEGQVSPALAGMASWLGEVETLDISVAQDGTEVVAGLGAGADAELLGAAIADDLSATGAGASLRLIDVAAEGDEGATRVNRITGRDEVLMSGYWVPDYGFEASEETCANEVNAVLRSGGVSFVTGSARLDARARNAVNALSGIMGLCLRETDMRAEISGHTDSTGNPDSNLALSRERAEAVRTALAARGLSVERLDAEGYGASQPVADNETEEGRAANRRTEIRWIQ